MKKIINVFTGPSLSVEVIKKQFPEVNIFPPAKQGDFLDKNFDCKDLILLVDGYYGSVPAIQHQEIIEILHRGASVFGCSSMGALRAAELYSVGMIGLGYVYEMYRNELLTGDDEVAVIHDPIDFSLLTFPLVNIRYGLSKLVQQNKLKASQAEEILLPLEKVCFQKRTFELLWNSVASTVGMEEANALYSAVTSEQNDIKGQDAINALNLIYKNFWAPMSVPETSFRRFLKQTIKNKQSYFNGAIYEKH